jgi:hypothetical protein
MKGELINGVWFVKMGGGINGWFVICMGDEMEDRSMVANIKTNGQWELQHV